MTGAARPGWMKRSGALGATLALALVLAACGGKGEETAAPASAAPDQATSAPVASTDNPSRPASTGSQPAAASLPAGGQLETSGWVLQPPFQAAGQEPYWRLNIEDGWFVFRRSGLPEIEAPMLQPKKVGGADVFETPPLTVSIKRGACEANDGGRSDVTAIVTFDDVPYDGCAFGASASSGGASAEAEAVAGAIKAIDACLEKLGEPALVTSIYPREGGRTAAALRTKNRTQYECAVEPGGGIAFMDEIEPGAAGPWMTSRMLFLRDGVANDLKCEGAEQVKAGDKVLGRLLTSKCRF